MAQLDEAAERGAAFDVALLDFHMPGENGIDLANRIIRPRRFTAPG